MDIENAHRFVNLLAHVIEFVGVAIIVGGVVLASVVYVLDGVRSRDWLTPMIAIVPISVAASSWGSNFWSARTSSPPSPRR